MLVVLGVGIAAFTLLLLNWSLVRQAGRFDRPVHTTTTDYQVRPGARRAVRITVTFDAAGRSVTTRLGGLTTRSDVVPRLRIVYDRTEPTRAMPADDFATGSSASTRALVWGCAATLGLDATVVLAAAVAGTRRMLRRSAAGGLSAARRGRSRAGPDAAP